MLRQWMENSEPLRREVGLHLENAQVTFALCVVIVHSTARIDRLFSITRGEARTPVWNAGASKEPWHEMGETTPWIAQTFFWRPIQSFSGTMVRSPRQNVATLDKPPRGSGMVITGP